MPNIPGRTVGRLSLYRRILNQLHEAGVQFVRSHELAQMSGTTAAQVRKDFMYTDYAGSPRRGYSVEGLLASVSGLLDRPEGQAAALVGAGNLGRAILAFFSGRRPKLRIAAAFDNDPAKTGRAIEGCPCHPLSKMPEVIVREGIDVGIVATPAEAAQDVADRLVESGVGGILNFAPVSLSVPSGVHVEDVDMTVALEKTAFFARQRGK